MSMTYSVYIYISIHVARVLRRIDAAIYFVPRGGTWGFERISYKHHTSTYTKHQYLIRIWREVECSMLNCSRSSSHNVGPHRKYVNVFWIDINFTFINTIAYIVWCLLHFSGIAGAAVVQHEIRQCILIFCKQFEQQFIWIFCPSTFGAISIQSEYNCILYYFMYTDMVYI